MFISNSDDLFICIHVISSLAWDGISHSPYTCVHHLTTLAMSPLPAFHRRDCVSRVEWLSRVALIKLQLQLQPRPALRSFLGPEDSRNVQTPVTQDLLPWYLHYLCKGQIFDQSCREMNCTNDCNESPDANTLTAHCHASHNQYWTWSLPNKLVKICLHPVEILLKDIRRLCLKVFTCVLWTTFMTIIRKWQMLIEGFFGRQQRQTKVDRGWQRTAKTEGGSQM